MKLNGWLLDRFRAGETTVLIVDEAQNLTYPVLEEIRLLTNLETSTQKLLQIVLSGQPELEEKLKLPQLRQLRQRIMLAMQDIAAEQKNKRMPICTSGCGSQERAAQRFSAPKLWRRSTSSLPASRASLISFANTR